MTLLWLMIACFGDDGKVETDTAGTCETIEDRSCGMGTPEGEDSACPEDYSCWGPSAFVCYRGECNLPICLHEQTRIDTPAGARPVSSLREGERIWTLDTSGARVARPIVAVGHMSAPDTHVLVQLTLADGRVVRASGGHPTALGLALEELQVGEPLDGSLVVDRQWLPYGGRTTFDVLPAGGTGVYWADGVLLGSTLAPSL